ncbi:MAG: hypothetical protein FJW09_08515 [Actinobacteria bacterium]|nr:hypothetical protein [Actinomycetota bacterium]
MIGVIASVVLGAVMCVAGGSKVIMGERWPAEARGMGTPLWLSPFVPWFEIVLGALLTAQVWRAPMAIIALLTLQAFTLVLLANLGRGHRPVCACFGSWSAKPVGIGHVVRNLALMLVAVIALVVR